MKTFWFNLPVKDIAKSKKFYTSIGFKDNTQYPEAAPGASFLIGENKVVMMLFPEEQFAGFASNGVSDTNAGTEVLLSIDAQSRVEVDTLAETVRKAGGDVFSKPAESQGWMYGFGFADPDGHRWNVLFMDMAKMSQ